MARQTVEIDNDLWQKFLKKLVDAYGSAYGSKKKMLLTKPYNYGWKQRKLSPEC